MTNEQKPVFKASSLPPPKKKKRNFLTLVIDLWKEREKEKEFLNSKHENPKKVTDDRRKKNEASPLYV